MVPLNSPATTTVPAAAGAAQRMELLPVPATALCQTGAALVPTIKFTSPLLLPWDVVTSMAPDCAPAGTTTPLICVPAAFTVKPDVTTLLAVPAKVMAVVP